MAANPDVQYQILALAHLVFSPSDLNQIWINAFNAGSFTPISDIMKSMGFTDLAIQEAQKVFTQGQWKPATLTTISGTLAQLPPYDGGGVHPTDTQAEVLVRVAKSIDRS